MNTSIQQQMIRLATTAMLAALMTVVFAGPALAHGRGTDASNFLSVITAEPDLSEITFEIVNSDEYLQLTNASDVEAMVPGYSGEPYLRIGPDGVFENRNSRATYVNGDRFGQVVVPPDVDVNADPEWRKISDDDSYAWHDHRVHWMATAQPPGVRSDPDSTQLVNQWTVPFSTGGQDYEVAGDLTWVPGGSALVWLIPALILVSIPVLYGLLATKPDLQALEWKGLSTAAGGTLLVIALANIVHLIDDLFATPIPLTSTLASAAQTAFFIAIAIFGAIRAIQGREGAFTALGVGSGAVFIGQGLLYFSVLSASQTASLLPGWLTRAIVAASVAQVIPMGIAAIRGTIKLLPDWDGEDELAAEAEGSSGVAPA